MHCIAEFYYVGKIPSTGIGRPSKQRRVVLRRGNTVVGGKCALLSALLILKLKDSEAICIKHRIKHESLILHSVIWCLRRCMCVMDCPRIESPDVRLVYNVTGRKTRHVENIMSPLHAMLRIDCGSIKDKNFWKKIKNIKEHTMQFCLTNLSPKSLRPPKRRNAKIHVQHTAALSASIHMLA